jgi:Calcineurin-like phosphoesterase
MDFWTDTQIDKALRILARLPRARYGEALEKIAEATGREVTGAALRNVFLRLKLGSPCSHMGTKLGIAKLAPKAPTKADLPALVQALLKVTKKGPVTFSNLCDQLDLSPTKTKRLLDEAKALGVPLHVEHDHVAFRPREADERVRTIGIAPVVGERQKVAVISDLHLGSKYCLREQLVEFIRYAYDQGVREILCPGDVLDGMYRHGLFEVSHTGLDDQARDLFETLPHLPGLNYRCITGNHDFTFTESCGVDVGHFLRNYFLERGRKDLHFYGNRGAFLKVKGAVIHLWHPRSGTSYARSYQLQKNIEKYGVVKPQIMLAGHWHVYCHVYERGVHGIACPTFQGGGSAFSKSLGGAPAIGGLLLSWDLTIHGTIRGFTIEKRSYFEDEKPFDIHNDLDGQTI